MNLNGDGLAVGLAAFREPFAESGGESFRIDLQAGFDLAFRDGQSVIEFGGASEIAHAEGVEPVERAGFTLAVDDRLDLQFLRVHSGSITPPEFRQIVPAVVRYVCFGSFSMCDGLCSLKYKI